jgi:hypothetical protein
MARTPVSLNTTYRALHVLAEAGELHSFLMGTEMLYRRCSPNRHCHLICIACARVSEEDLTAIPPWVDDVAKRWQGRVLDYYADILVLCQECQPAHLSDPALATAHIAPAEQTNLPAHRSRSATPSQASDVRPTSRVTPVRWGSR